MGQYQKVKNWLVSSGLCILDKEDQNAGAVHSYYDTKDNKYSFLYPEITGYYLSTRKFIETSTWYAQKGCFGIKLAMPLLQLGDPKLREIAIKIANTYNKFQNSDGSFALHLGSKSVNLHSHCYALEGLIYAYAMLKESAYLDSCRKGLDWVLSQMNEDGSVYLWTNYNYKSKAAYPIAQLIRLMVLVDSVASTSKYLKPPKQLTDFLLTLQATEEDAKMNGGFYEEFHKSIMGWKKQHRINSWTSMFALQALDWIENHNKISFERSIEYLY